MQEALIGGPAIVQGRSLWPALAPKGAIDLELDPEDPRRSFDAISRGP